MKSGSILIDGIDISTIPINQARGSLNILSQEPFFLRGTIRDNLITASSVADPDELLQSVLVRTGLWSKVISSGGLDTTLDAEELFSHGERQLFCLARAMLNDSKILLLDEFTSRCVRPFSSFTTLHLTIILSASTSKPIEKCRRLSVKNSKAKL